jgi:hypothetical protein
MMASAAARQASFERLRRKGGSALAIQFRGMGSPITPVEAISTWVFGQSNALAARATVSATESTPALPVKALALPEFTRIARARPPRRARRHHSTGADAVLERVSTPAIVEPGTSSMRQTSVRPR